MKVAIIKERRAPERRVAASPDTVKHMVGMKLEPVVESGAGAEACFLDAAYSAAGATIVADAATALSEADIVLKVQRPLLGGADGIDELRPMRRGADCWVRAAFSLRHRTRTAPRLSYAGNGS